MAKTSNDKNKNTGRSRFVKCLVPMILTAIIIGGGFYSFYHFEIEKYKEKNAELENEIEIYKGKSDMLLDEVDFLKDSIFILNVRLDSLFFNDSVIIHELEYENEVYRQKLLALDSLTSDEHYKFFTRYLDTARVKGFR